MENYVQTAINLISSVGFPILAYLQLFKFVQSQDENHKSEVDELRTAIENNTLVLTKVLERMEVTEDAI